MNQGKVESIETRLLQEENYAESNEIGIEISQFDSDFVVFSWFSLNQSFLFAFLFFGDVMWLAIRSPNLFFDNKLLQIYSNLLPQLKPIINRHVHCRFRCGCLRGIFGPQGAFQCEYSYLLMWKILKVVRGPSLCRTIRTLGNVCLAFFVR